MKNFSPNIYIEKAIIMRHIFFLLLINMAIFSLFVFILIPFLIKYSAYVKDNNYTEKTLEIYLPQTPILNALPKQSNQQKIAITGFGQANSTLYAVVNEKEILAGKINDDGEFSTEVDLIDGDNSLYVYTIDDKKQKSGSSKEYLIYLDQEEPYLDISEPAEGQEFQGIGQKLLSVKGITKSYAKVYLNGRLSKASVSGDFQIQYYLNEGENILDLEVIDLAGNSTSEKRTVTYKE